MKYQFPIRHPLPENTYLIIKNGTFIERTKEYGIRKGKLKWHYECLLELNYIPKPPVDANEIFPFRQLCIELKAYKKDTINFRTTFSGNLHVTGHAGQLIRLK